MHTVMYGVRIQSCMVCAYGCIRCAYGYIQFVRSFNLADPRIRGDLMQARGQEMKRLWLSLPCELTRIKNYTQGVITPQKWIKGTEMELSDSEVLSLPGGFKPATPKSPA